MKATFDIIACYHDQLAHSYGLVTPFMLVDLCQDNTKRRQPAMRKGDKYFVQLSPLCHPLRMRTNFTHIVKCQADHYRESVGR